MAQVGNISARVSMDTAEFRRGIQTMNQQLGIAREQFRQATIGLDSVEDASQIAEEQTRMLTRQIELQQRSVEQLNEVYEESVRQFGENSAQAVRYQRQLERARTSLRQMENDLENVNDELENVSENTNESSSMFDSLGSSMGDIIGNLPVMSAGFAGVGTAIVAGIGKSIQANEEFEKALDDLMVQTGKTKDEVNSLSDELEDIYISGAGDSLEDIARSMGLVEQNAEAMGITTEEELENVTKKALELRDSFEFEIAQSINGITQLTSVFGIKADEAFNLVVQGVQQGANKGEDLMELLWEYSVHFENLGFTAEDMFNIFIQGAKDGTWSIDKLGDGVKEFNLISSEGSEEFKEALKDLGLNYKQLTDDVIEGGDKGQEAFNEIVQALKEVEDQQEQNNLGVALFGTVFEDLQIKGIESLTSINKHVDKTENSMEKLNEVNMDDLDKSLERLSRTMEMKVFKPIGAKLKPAIADFINTSIDSTEKSMGLMKRNAEKIMNDAKNDWKDFTKEFNDFKDQFYLVGTQIWEGLVEGIESGWNNVKEATKKIGEVALDGIKKVLEVFSPSKAFEKIGSFVVDGFNEGISGNLDSVELAGELFVNAFNNSVKTEISGTQKYLNDIIDDMTESFEKLTKQSISGIDDLNKSLTDVLEKRNEDNYKLITEGRENEIKENKEKIDKLKIQLLNSSNEETENKKKIQIENLERLNKNLTYELNQIKKNNKKLLDEEYAREEAKQMIVKGEQDKIIAIMKHYRPQWLDEGKSLGEMMILGVESSSENIANKIQTIFNNATTVLQSNSQNMIAESVRVLNELGSNMETKVKEMKRNSDEWTKLQERIGNLDEDKTGYQRRLRTLTSQQNALHQKNVKLGGSMNLQYDNGRWLLPDKTNVYTTVLIDGKELSNITSKTQYRKQVQNSRGMGVNNT